MTNQKRNVLYLSHGGGPMPLLGDKGHEEMVDILKYIASKMNKPSAILVISAHWEEKIPSVTSGENPSLIYDYYGFPKESYHIQYPCPGSPLLANQVRTALIDSGIDARLDGQRGFDHGLFVPLKIMYSEADIPCVQLSLIRNLNPAQHIQIGSALSDLVHNNLLIIGSGFSFHNLRAFFSTVTAESKSMNENFELWLTNTCSNPEIQENERYAKLIHWEQAPFARYCHPREEHLLPLHVCYGVAGMACSEHFSLTIMNKKSSLYLWTM